MIMNRIKRSLLVGGLVLTASAGLAGVSEASASKCNHNYSKWFDSCISVKGTSTYVQTVSGTMTNEGSSYSYGWKRFLSCPSNALTTSCTSIYNGPIVKVEGGSTYFSPVVTYNRNFADRSWICSESIWHANSTGQNVSSSYVCIQILA